MKERLINLIKIIILLLVFFTISKVIVLGFTIIGFDVRTFTDGDVAYLEALLEAILFLLVLFFYKRYILHDKNIFKMKFKEYIPELIKYIFIFAIVKIASALFASLFASMLGIDLFESENQQAITTITMEAPIIMLITTSILTPVVEEGIFRLGFKTIIKNRYAFIVISGLVFGFMHIFPTDLNLTVALLESINYVALGITLAYIYAKTDNIWFVIFIHGINNLLSMLALIGLS